MKTATGNWYEYDIDRACKSINKAYEMLGKAIDENDDEAADKWGDTYDQRITYYSNKFGVSENWIEDCATNCRMYGYDCS